MFARHSWRRLLGVGLALALAALPSVCRGQQLAQRPARQDGKAGEPELLNAPRKESGKGADKDDDEGLTKRPPDQPILPVSYPGGLYPAIPVTLPDVLKLSVLANLDVAQANLAVERARLAVLRARAQYLPDVTAGPQYQAHNGTIQRTEGNIIFVDRDSLFVGGGPFLNLDVSSALFGPAQARALLEAAQAGRARVTLDTLFRVADAYFAVLRARRQLARLDEVLDMMTSEQESELRGKSKGLLPVIRAFVKAGDALPSDQARVEADVVRRQGERIKALEDVRTASAELSRLLHLNAGYFLLPAEDYRYPLQVPGGQWFKTPIEDLIAQSLRARPELAENAALVEAAVLRYKQAKWQPLLPNIQAGLSWGGFGGGPELLRNPRGVTFLGTSGVINNFDVRTDVTLAAVWRLENLGVGNVARIRDARLQTQQAEVQLLLQQDLIVAQVVQAMEGVQRGEARYYVYRAGLFDDSGNATGTVYRAVRLNFLRIRGGQGLPLEVLDSIRRLSDVLQGYADTISDYDRNRYRLLVALGLPPASFIEPAPPEPHQAPDTGHQEPAACRGKLDVAPPANDLQPLRGVPLPPIGQGGSQAPSPPRTRRAAE
jgi:outer membrane protein TolC